MEKFGTNLGPHDGTSTSASITTSTTTAATTPSAATGTTLQVQVQVQVQLQLQVQVQLQVQLKLENQEDVFFLLKLYAWIEPTPPECLEAFENDCNNCCIIIAMDCSVSKINAHLQKIKNQEDICLKRKKPSKRSEANKAM